VPKVHIGKTVIIHKDPFAYISHPSITITKRGEWVAAFNHSRRREPRQHPPTDPLFRTIIARSKDQGETWSDPYFAPDFDYYGTECPGIETLKDGTVVLTQFRFAWYPLAVARKRRAAGELISLHLHRRGWTEDFTDADWESSRFTWARGYHGVYVHLSEDEGYSFDTTVKLDTDRFRDGYSRTGVEELSDGRLAYVVTEHHPPHSQYTYIVFSQDRGRTWSKPTVVVDQGPDMSKRQFSEPDVLEVNPGELLCILRDSKKTGYLHSTRSLDGGATWTPTEQTTMFGHPGHLLKLSDGRILCTYGRREAPFGIRAALSEDGGRTWLVDDEIVIRADLPNGDLGYPTTIEYAPGRLFVCYYGQEPDGVTCVQGTYVELG